MQSVDANQKWEVQEAIDWMKALAPYKPLWIEEPTSPDDVLGHAAIAKVGHPAIRDPETLHTHLIEDLISPEIIENVL